MTKRDGSDEFWFNVTTKRVEQGRQGGWQDVMGPYPTRAAAEHALEQAEARNEAWDAQDEK